jgi:hypothetical protein
MPAIIRLEIVSRKMHGLPFFFGTVRNRQDKTEVGSIILSSTVYLKLRRQILALFSVMIHTRPMHKVIFSETVFFQKEVSFFQEEVIWIKVTL